jgi:hypothetical protein
MLASAGCPPALLATIKVAAAAVPSTAVAVKRRIIVGAPFTISPCWLRTRFVQPPSERGKLAELLIRKLRNSAPAPGRSRSEPDRSHPADRPDSWSFQRRMALRRHPLQSCLLWAGGHLGHPRARTVAVLSLLGNSSTLFSESPFRQLSLRAPSVSRGVSDNSSAGKEQRLAIQSKEILNFEPGPGAPLENPRSRRRRHGVGPAGPDRDVARRPGDGRVGDLHRLVKNAVGDDRPSRPVAFCGVR